MRERHTEREKERERKGWMGRLLMCVDWSGLFPAEPKVWRLVAMHMLFLGRFLAVAKGI